MDNKDILPRRIDDLFGMCEKYHKPVFSDFLDEADQQIIKIHTKYDCIWFGGYKDAQRKMLGVVPEWCEIELSEFPILALRIRNKGYKQLSHRDYLGTLMSLGIDRKKIGDILVEDANAYVFSVSEIAHYIKNNITKISNVGVECDIIDFDESYIKPAKFILKDVVVASTRLDTIVATCVGMSRKNATEYILSGRCSVNHIKILKSDFNIKEEDILSLRGYGRFVIYKIGNNTKSGKLHITIKKFI